MAYFLVALGILMMATAVASIAREVQAERRARRPADARPWAVVLLVAGFVLTTAAFFAATPL